MSNSLERFRRYESLIQPVVAGVHGFAAESEDTSSIQVERGIIFPQAIADPPLPDRSAVERLIELSTGVTQQSGAPLHIVDRTGHRRPVYPALLIYSWLQAYQLAYETLPPSEFGRWEEALRAWCDRMESDLGKMQWPTGALAAHLGSSATEAAWTALALFVAGKIYIRDAWTDLAADTFGHFVKRQLPNGPLLQLGMSDNPETYWYHELVTLHAAASYAVQGEDRTVAALVQKATQFHAEETQPDHASDQPWGLFAFIWNPATNSVADQMLHRVGAGPMAGVSLMLLADALYCLRLFTAPNTT